MLDDGTLITYGFDIESEMIAREMGFEPHPCFGAMDDALWEAARDGNIDTVEILLAAGANVHVYNDDALRLAAARGHADVVKVLLEAGADPYVWDNYVFDYAGRLGYVEVVAVLEDWIKDHG